MATNSLNTRIKLKYDTLSNWHASSIQANPFIPLQGEVCVAVIPNSTVNDYTVGNPDSSGLSPYAIGLKVGDGNRTFDALPWIQSIAGDVYGWAKGAVPGNSITVNYGGPNQTATLQQAISGIESSIGGIVSANISSDALTAALQQLAQQTGGQSTLFESNTYVDGAEEGDPPVRQYPTKIIRSIERDGLNITVTGDNLAIEDLPITFQTAYNASTNKVATMADITSAVNANLTSIMKLKGVSSTEIKEGTQEGYTYPTIGGTIITNLNVGDVVLYRQSRTINQGQANEETIASDYEFVWTGATSGWELLGDEGSYAIRGSIKKTDLNADLQSEINDKLDSTAAASTYVAKNGTDRLMTANEGTKLNGIETGAQVNVIETVKVNGSALTPDVNKAVDVTIPLLNLKKHSEYGSTDTTTAVTIANDKTITLDEIAFTGDVKNLKQSDTILIFDCGSSTQVIS